MIKENIKINYPRWFSICMTFCGIVTIGICSTYIVWVIINGIFGQRLWRITFSASLITLITWFLLRIVFYSVQASEEGLRSNAIMGKRIFVAWKDIIEIRKPKFNIPHDAVYVITNSNKKLMLVKGMKNLDKMITAIKLNSPNLRNIKLY